MRQITLCTDLEALIGIGPRKYRWRRRIVWFWRWELLWLIAFSVTMFVRSSSQCGCQYGTDNGANVLAAVFGSLCFVPPVIWFFWAVFRFELNLADQRFKSAAAAVQTIPSPQEIYVGLQSEWGRPPTDVEVLTVQQALINRRNEALITAGVSFGALYMLLDAGHRANGR